MTAAVWHICFDVLDHLLEFLRGIGLIVPATTGVRPKLALFAASGPTLVMILAAVFHIGRARTTLCPPMWRWEGAPRSSRMDACL